MGNEKSAVPNEPKPARRRWFQFSLRTMIVATAIFCILLATWIIPSERQRRACQKIDESVGYYVFEDEKLDGNYVGPFVPNSDLRRWHHHYFKNVKEIYCFPRNFDAQAFPYLEKLTWTGIPVGTFTTPVITEEQLAGVAKNNLRLKEFSFNHVEIQPESMQHFSSLIDLHKLDLGGVDLSNCSFDPLASLNELRELNLLGTKVQNHELAKLKKLPYLKKIYVDMNAKSADRLKILCDFQNLKEAGGFAGPILLQSSITIPIKRMREILKEYNEKNTPESPYEINWDLEAAKLRN